MQAVRRNGSVRKFPTGQARRDCQLPPCNPVALRPVKTFTARTLTPLLSCIFHQVASGERGQINFNEASEASAELGAPVLRGETQFIRKDRNASERCRNQVTDVGHGGDQFKGRLHAAGQDERSPGDDFQGKTPTISNLIPSLPSNLIPCSIQRSYVTQSGIVEGRTCI